MSDFTASGNPACDLCGATALTSNLTCKEMYEKVLAREYNNPAYGVVHLLSVDAYTLQHSELFSQRLNAYHLLRLCWTLKYGGDPRIGQPGFTSPRLAQSYRKFPVLEPPLNRGLVTVADVYEAPNALEHVRQVWRWSQSVWLAWEVHHAWAHAWVEKLK